MAAVAGWLVAIAFCLFAVYGGYNKGDCEGCFDWSGALQHAYLATARDVFSLGIAWLMFACVTGYGGVFE